MRWAWFVGVLHGLIGSTLLFLTLHPLRDALNAEALELVQVGSALQAVQGLALIVLAQVPAALIAGGTAVWTAMLYYIAFSGQHPLDLVVPIGGLAMMLGWLALLFTPPGKA